MTSDLTSLAGVVGDSVDRWANRGHLILPGPVDLAPSLAKAISADALAAGWRPPARVITDPAELDALPQDSVVLAIVLEVGYGQTPTPFLRASGLPSHWWGTDGHTHESASLVAHTSALGGTVRVLYTPASGDADGHH